MRALAAITALSFIVAPGSQPHEVTLRIDAVAANSPTKVDVKAPVPGLHLGGSNTPGQSQTTADTPFSVTVDANVDALMIDAQNQAALRVSFEKGGSARELALRISGNHLMLRRNADGDLVM